MKLTITINGGPDNPWAMYGLKRNPFPIIGKAEASTAEHMLQTLDSDPITSTDQIRKILHGCDERFIAICCQEFVPGERVRFTVEWPGGW